MTKILVIDDEAALLEELCENLVFEGFEVISSSDSLQGVQLAQQHRPDLILCDIMMPKLDGYGVLLELRSSPATAGIPFIFLTARVARQDWRKGMQLGADDYLTKPFLHTELLEAINIQLQKQAVRHREMAEEVTALEAALTKEQELRLLKSRFVAMASHEFRNPLTTIMSSNNLLRDYGDRMSPERRVIHMERIESAVNQMLYLLDDMLVIGKVETGMLSLSESEFSLAELCNTIVEELRQMYQETHQLVFECYYDSMVFADQKLIRFVIVNLLTNALKYSPNGGDVLLRLAREREQILIQVEDRGIGIPEQDKPALFGAFQRASNVGAIQGTGLGLTIVKQAVELHRGSISFESQVGLGTVFTVALPICVQGR
ncbi:MAG: response regulator [Anaerolineae bacterium]